jgi:small-conductance mechanosensitive channel
LDIQQFLQFVNVDKVPIALLVLVGGLALLRVLTRTMDDLAERFTDRRLLFKKISAFSRFFVYGLLAVGTTTSLLRIEAETMQALATALGLALSMGFQGLIGSLLGGIVLLINEPFQVGDRVQAAGYYGEITEIGLLSTRLVTLDDNLVSIPNSKFLADASASANAGALDCMVVIPFYIAAAEDFGRARRLITEATVTSRYVYLEKPVVTLISDEFMGERFVTVIRVKAYVLDARYEKAFASDVTERAKRALFSAGIRAPDRAYRDLEVFGAESPDGATSPGVQPA